MTRFNAGMSSMEARAKTATAKMSLAGMRMTKYLTLPIAGVGYMAVKASTNFESAMVKIQTQAGATAKMLPKIRQGIMAMSGKDVMQGPTELADAYYHLQSVMGNIGKNGTVAAKLKMLKSIGQLSQIGGSSMEDTTSAVAGILRTHLKGATNVLQIVKTINGIVGSGNMRMPQFVESTGTAVLQIAKLLGMSLKDVGAAEAVFTDENMNANMSMTRLRTSLMMAIHPSQAAAKQMQLLGVTSEQIGVKMRGPHGFVNTLDYLGNAYDNYVKKLEARGKTHKEALTEANAALFGSFGGSKGASVWATLINQRDVVHQKEGQITEKEKKWNKDLAASSHTMAVQFKKAWASMQKGLIDFGVALSPVVLGAAHAIANLAEAFHNLPKSTQKIIMGVALALATMGPLLIMTSSLIKVFTDFGMLFRAGGLLTAGVGALLPLALMAGVAALVYFAWKSKKFRADLISWGKAIQGFFVWLGKDVLVPAAKRFYHFWHDGGQASRWKTDIIPALKAVGHTFITLGRIVDAVTHAIFRDFNKFMKIEGKIESFAGKIYGGLAGANDSVGNFFKGAAGHITGKDYGPTSHMSKRGAAAYRRFVAKAAQLGMTPGQYETYLTRHPGAGGGGGRNQRQGANVHIHNMHVRHESDSEVVAARIHNRMLIP